MSPYITSLFDKVSEAEAIASTLKKDTTTLDDVINKFKNDLGQKVAPRILFPIVKDITMTTKDKTNTVFYFIPCALLHAGYSMSSSTGWIRSRVVKALSLGSKSEKFRVRTSCETFASENCLSHRLLCRKFIRIEEAILVKHS